MYVTVNMCNLLEFCKWKRKEIPILTWWGSLCSNRKHLSFGLPLLPLYLLPEGRMFMVFYRNTPCTFLPKWWNASHFCNTPCLDYHLCAPARQIIDSWMCFSIHFQSMLSLQHLYLAHLQTFLNYFCTKRFTNSEPITNTLT